MEEIQSFEVSEEEIYGDILSERIAERKLKVGLLAAGYFEYWRMYPKTLKETVEKDMQIIAAQLRKKFDLVYPGLVDTLDRAEEAGRTFEKEAVDLLIVAEGTYVPDFMALQAIDHVPHVPVLLFSSQFDEAVHPGTDYEERLRNSGLIGIAQLTGTFAKMGRKYEAVVGSINDSEVYEHIGAFASAVDVVRRLRDLNIGALGHVFRGMYDLEQDKTKLKGQLGPNVIYIQISHLLALWEAVADSEAQALADWTKKRYPVVEISDDDIFRSCRLAIAMKRLIEKFKLDALCFLGQHYIQARTKASARFGSSLLLEEGKYMVSCEGDLAGLVMMVIMKWLTGISPLFAEWGEFDVEHNAVLMMMHGFADPSLAKSPSEVTITPTPENWGFEGQGMNYQFITKPGPVTMGHFLDDPAGWRMLIATGEAIDFPCLPCYEMTAMVRVKPPVKEFLETILRKGVAHHAVVVHGDVRRELGHIADLMGIEKLVV